MAARAGSHIGDVVRAVDLFAGFGGFTAAASGTGRVEVVWAANHWPAAVHVHALNHPTVDHSIQDLRQADFSAVARRHGPIRLVLASPSCQGHSPAGQPARRHRRHVRRTHDAYRATAWAVIDAAEVLAPDALVVENVMSFQRWQLYSLWCQAFEQLGYTVSAHVVNAAAWQVPQRRQRLFVCAVRNDAPAPLVASGTSDEVPIGPFLEPDDVGEWKLVRRAPAGVQDRVARGICRHGGERFVFQNTTGHSGLRLSEPLRTVTTAACHWALADPESGRYRYLSGRELARAMGFDDSYRWDSTLSVAEVTRGLGNAVCPPAAAAVVDAVVDSIL